MIEQLAIVVCGVISVFASQDVRPTVRRWACIFGLGAQPFWIASTWHAGQWGMLILSLVYTSAWMVGFWNFWLRPLRS